MISLFSTIGKNNCSFNFLCHEHVTIDYCFKYPNYKFFIQRSKLARQCTINSDTGSSSSFLIDSVISSFSTKGKNNCSFNFLCHEHVTIDYCFKYPNYKFFIQRSKLARQCTINSDTGSSSSFLIDSVISSFSTKGKNNCTNSKL